MCLRTGSGWHSTYQRRRNPCFQRETLNHISQKGSLTPSFSSHPLHLEEKRNTEMWKLPKFNYFYWKCQKTVKTYPLVKRTQGALWTFAAVCLSFFFSSLFSSLVPQVANFHFSFPRSKRTDCPLETSKGCFGFCHLRQNCWDTLKYFFIKIYTTWNFRKACTHTISSLCQLSIQTPCIKIEPISD